MIWNEFIDFSSYAQIMMSGFLGAPEITVNGGHTDIRYTSDRVDLANISIIDMREEKKMWMMHIACFAKPEFPMPIYGFDVICGKNKVTGCFHDMSPTVSHLVASSAEYAFKKNVEPFVPKRERELPEWAKRIFSKSMVVAGATDDPSEIRNLSHMGKENLFAWFEEVDFIDATESFVKPYNAALSLYCESQLSNTNSKNVMISLGLEKDYVERFKKQQFPY